MSTFRQRRGTAAALAAANETPAAGQIYVETDTFRLKVGDGATAYNSLPYISSPIASVSGLQAALDAKAALSHTHTIANVTGLQAALDGKQIAGSYAASVHSHSASDITSGTFSSSRLPASGVVAGTYTSVTVDSTGRVTAGGNATPYTLPIATASVLGGVKIGSGLALGGDGTISVPAGSVAVATSTVLGAVKIGSGVSVAGDGTISVSFPVSSVAGKTGVVSLVKADVGLGNVDNTSDASKPISTAVQAALDGKQAAGSYAAAVHAHVIADVTGLQAALDGKQATGSYAAAVHAHAIADVTGLQSALDGKQASGSYAAATHTHDASAINAGTVASARLPLATTSVVGGVKIGAGISVSVDGTISVSGVSSQAVLVDSSAGTTVYVGKATAGTAASSSGWTIKRTTFSSLGALQTTTTATGIWNNRTSLSYS